MTLETVDQKTRATRERYDRISGFYDALATSWETPAVDAGLALLYARPGESILDIGCGTGAALLKIARSIGETGLAAAVDISPKMVRAAKHRLERAGIHQGTVREADGRALPFTDATFHAIFMSFVLELFDDDDAQRVLAECRRVMRPDGRIVVVGLSQTGGISMMTGLYQLAHAHFPNVIDCRPINVAQTVTRGGFLVQTLQHRSLMGLGIEVLRALI